MWTKLDDHYPDHPKVVGLSDAAFRLHVRAMCYAAAHLTDGLIPDGWLKGSPDTLSELVSSGLLEPTDGGFQIHDYLDHNPSREEHLAKRRKTTQRVTEWRKTHGYSKTRNGVTNDVNNSVGNASRNDVGTHPPVPVPVPVRYTNSPTSSGNAPVTALPPWGPTNPREDDLAKPDPGPPRPTPAEIASFARLCVGLNQSDFEDRFASRFGVPWLPLCPGYEPEEAASAE